MANLEIIDMLCEINTRLSDLVRRMATEMEQANIADEVQENIRKEKAECEELMDLAEYKLRRTINERNRTGREALGP